MLSFEFDGIFTIPSQSFQLWALTQVLNPLELVLLQYSEVRNLYATLTFLFLQLRWLSFSTICSLFFVGGLRLL